MRARNLRYSQLPASPSFAMMSIAQVSRERADEMGVELRTSPSGPHAVWLEFEFMPEGRLKDYHHVSLEIREKDKLLVGYAALKEEKRPDTGSIRVQFMAARDYLDKITLSLVVGVPMNMAGYELQVRDFVSTEQAAP